MSQSAYEKARNERIERNRQRLKALGVADAAQAVKKAQRRPRKAGSGKKAKAGDSQERRRSRRVQQLEAVDYGPLPDDLDDVLELQATTVKARKRTAKAKAPGAASAPVDASSSRATLADWQGMEERHLGLRVRPRDGTGAMKAAVMGEVRGNGQRPPKFNKFSGVIEFKNCMCLFVNVTGRTGSDYLNSFTHGGRCLWFGVKQVKEHPQVQKLLSTTPLCENGKRADGPASGSSNGADACHPVLLFCREEGEAYVCCGRVGVRSYKEAEAPGEPFQVELQLLSFDKLQKSEEFRAVQSPA
ncbi:unnamed protein product [Pedinophyceae sp. YPF-701]|nr:unnamed protein product [Pedinophyceae sp. YPF-701]